MACRSDELINIHFYVIIDFKQKKSILSQIFILFVLPILIWRTRRLRLNIFIFMRCVLKTIFSIDFFLLNDNDRRVNLFYLVEFSSKLFSSSSSLLNEHKGGFFTVVNGHNSESFDLRLVAEDKFVSS